MEDLAELLYCSAFFSQGTQLETAIGNRMVTCGKRMLVRIQVLYPLSGNPVTCPGRMICPLSAEAIAE